MKGLHHQIAKLKGLEYWSLRQKTRLLFTGSSESQTSLNLK